MDIRALIKPVVAACVGAGLGALLFGVDGAIWLAALAGLGTWGLDHGLGCWLREIPQRLGEWRTARDSDAFSRATAAAGIIPSAPAPSAPAAPLPRPRRGQPGPAGAGTPPAGGEGIPPRETDPGFSAEQSDLMHAITSIVNRASKGDIIDVRRAIKILASAGGNLASGTMFLGTRLAEPDRHLGPEIWEPTGGAGHHFQAGALLLEQADAMTTSLMQMTLGEVAASPRQGPDRSMLNGGI